MRKCNHEDRPITYCEKCKTFFIYNRDGSRDEIDIVTEDQYVDGEKGLRKIRRKKKW